MADRTRTRLLTALKSAGPQTAADLAHGLKVTTVAVRQHLEGLSREDLVDFEDLKGSVGRPKRLWSLTRAGHQLFPDNHSNLVLGLLTGLGDIFGEEGLERLIAHREARSLAAYEAAMTEAASLGERVEVLARLRNQEGYMAEVTAGEDRYLLIENHCSICAAATACQGFCRSELSLFRKVLGPGIAVERIEHQLSGGRRCVYTIAPEEGAPEKGTQDRDARDVTP